MDRKIRPIAGFTIIEILIIIVIVSIIAYAFFKPINEKIVAHKVDEETKKIYSLLQEGRMIAFSKKMNLQFKLTSGSACLYDEDNNQIKCVQLELPFSNITIKIDDRGVFESQATIQYTGSNTSPTVDCIKISYIRVRMGKLRDGECYLK